MIYSFRVYLASILGLVTLTRFQSALPLLDIVISTPRRFGKIASFKQRRIDAAFLFSFELICSLSARRARRRKSDGIFVLSIVWRVSSEMFLKLSRASVWFPLYRDDNRKGDRIIQSVLLSNVLNIERKRQYTSENNKNILDRKEYKGNLFRVFRRCIYLFAYLNGAKLISYSF